jgi:hypothetical protein
LRRNKGKEWKRIETNLNHQEKRIKLRKMSISRLGNRPTKSIQGADDPGIRIPNTGLHKNIHRFLKSKKIKGKELVDYSNVIYDFIMQVNPHIK